MIHEAKAPLLVAVLLVVLGVAADAPGQALGQHGGHDHGATAPNPPPASEPSKTVASPAPLRVTMEELHRHGGVPRGWRFSLPSGDPAKGRQVFADLECYKCHAIKGEGFPPAGGDDKSVGPELTGMGGQHPAEYLAESVLAPNRVIVLGQGFTGPDGLSIMPSFADSITLVQWMNLVAYLKTLTGGGDDPHHGGGAIERERVEVDYRVRLVYTPAGGGHGQRDAEHAAHHASHGGAGSGHLAAFVSDRETGEAVPYLPVTVTVHVAGAAPRSVRLAPMLDERGFHYGTDVALPAGTERLTVAIGSVTMRVMDTARKRFAQPVSLVFDWTAR